MVRKNIFTCKISSATITYKVLNDRGGFCVPLLYSYGFSLCFRCPCVSMYIRFQSFHTCPTALLGTVALCIRKRNADFENKLTKSKKVTGTYALITFSFSV